jgi:hypothetical protein
MTRSEALAIYVRATALAGVPGLDEALALSTALQTNSLMKVHRTYSRAVIPPGGSQMDKT